MPITQANRNLAINTPLGEDKLLLASVAITEQMGRMFHMDVELLSEDANLDFSAVVGGNASIRMTLANSKTPRYFNGYVSRFVQTDADHSGGRYRATLVPWLWFLTRTADCRIFQAMTVPNIIKKVFRDHGFTDFKDSLSGTYTPWENCVQYRETDFNFVSRLMEHEGIYYFFEHENGKHTLVLADSASAHSTAPNYDSVPFSSTRSGARIKETVTQWTIEQEVQPGTYSLNDFNFEKPKTSLVAQSNITTQNAQSSFEMYDYPGEYGEQSDGSDYSKIRIEEAHTQHEIVQGQSNARGLCTGFKFSLTGALRQDQNRTYLITSVSYQLHNDNMGGSGEGGSGGEDELFSCSFTAMDATKPFRTARSTPKPLIQGPQTAIVVGPKGEEIHTDKYGRVKVQFHWDRYGKADENSSCWIRISQAAWAGKNWGSLHIPRIGQEVIVEFLEGDPDLPIITGRVYNADAMPPYPLPDEKTKTTLKSNSSKGGNGFNELRFEDKKGSEQLFMHAEKNLDIRVKNDRMEYTGNDRHLHVTNDKFEKIDANRHENIGVSHFEKIASDRNLDVGGKEAIHVAGNSSTKVDGTLIYEVGGNVSEKVSGSVSISATGKIVLQSAANITLVVGGSSIAIDSGSITIKTTTLELDATALTAKGSASAEVSGGTLALKGSGMASLKAPMVAIN